MTEFVCLVLTKALSALGHSVSNFRVDLCLRSHTSESDVL